MNIKCISNTILSQWQGKQFFWGTASDNNMPKSETQVEVKFWHGVAKRQIIQASSIPTVKIAGLVCPRPHSQLFFINGT